MDQQIADGIVAAMRKPAPGELALVEAIYRRLLEGTPAPIEDLASATGREPRDVDARLEAWPGVFRDATGAVIGFWGLSSEPMPIRVRSEAGEASAWCALDPLFILPLVGVDGEVRTQCPATSAPIRIRVGARIEAVEPSAPAMTLLPVTEEFGDDVQDTFCHHVLFFQDADAAAAWSTGRPGTVVVGLDEADALGRRIAATLRP